MKLEIMVKRYTNKNGDEFLGYKALTKKGWIDLRFTRAVAENDRPTTSCFINVKSENVSINKTQRFPVIWVSKIESIEEIEFKRSIEEFFDVE